MTARGAPPYYWDYLQLDQLLGAQRPRSSGRDELLFIIVHQAFELWFKQILFELGTVLEVMGAAVVPEKEMGQVVARLGRITAIQRLLLDQIEVLETMTPLDFLDFRDELIPASGFQSVQFRLIENRLGLRPPHRLRIRGTTYLRVLSAEHARALEASQHEPSLLDRVDRWLERTPFLRLGGYDFWRSYQHAVEQMLSKERQVIQRHPNLDEPGRAEQLATLDQTAANFAAVFDGDRYAQLVTRGKRQLSHQAFLAALLINLYRDEPIFQLPFRLLTALIDIDEGFTTWRYRHALLAHRMIGGRIGTGGTAGHAYLEAAARKHRVFRDLFDLPTFFIPRSALPTLPPEVTEQMGFRYRMRR
ncbi:MAG TPA: tryptophan 2,3-dioxygenase family protein [Pseudonocardiaceae bacterium]|jgi:tryptophan 2,3-dioxygenase